MKQVNSFLARIYLLIIYITFIVIIILGISSFQYFNDVINKKYFGKVTCTNIFYGKLKIRDGSKNWHCSLLDSTDVEISIIDNFDQRNAILQSNDIWYNSATHRAYPYSEEPIEEKLLNKINWNIFYASGLFLLSTLAIYESTKRNK